MAASLPQTAPLDIARRGGAAARFYFFDVLGLLPPPASSYNAVSPAHIASNDLLRGRNVVGNPPTARALCKVN